VDFDTQAFNAFYNLEKRDWQSSFLCNAWTTWT